MSASLSDRANRVNDSTDEVGEIMKGPTSARRAGLCVVVAACVLMATGCTSTSALPDVPTPSGHTFSSAPVQLRPGVLASIPVDPEAAPGPLAVGDGSIWVGAHRANYLWRIDPASDKIIARIDLGQNVCGPIAIIDTLVWTGYCDGSSKGLAVDPTTNQVVKSFAASGPYAEVGGFLWGSDADTNLLTKYDGQTLEPVATVQASGNTAVFDGRYLWLADEDYDGTYHGHLSQVDLTTGAVVKVISTPSNADGALMDLVEGIIWMKGSGDDSLLRVDTVTGDSTEVPLAHSYQPSQFWDPALADGMGSLWVRTSDAEISRLDPKTGALQGTYPADSQGGGGYIGVGFGSLWVANFGSDQVWRDRIAGR